MIKKTNINQDQATNRTAIISGIGTLIGVADGVFHGREIGSWLPTLFIGGGATIAQWLQGTPSPELRTIASVLRLNGNANNAQLIRSAIDRILSSGVVPGLPTTQPEYIQHAQTVPSPATPTRLRVADRVQEITNDMSSRLANRQRPMEHPAQPMTRSEWNDWNQYPEVVQTGHDPDEMSPPTTAR